MFFFIQVGKHYTHHSSSSSTRSDDSNDYPSPETEAGSEEADSNSVSDDDSEGFLSEDQDEEPMDEKLARTTVCSSS